MTQSKYAQALPIFTADELRGFRDARRGTVVPAEGPQEQYVRQLRSADEQASFRFLELPPELRDLIYHELLILRTQGDGSKGLKCWPAILRTSKEVHDEAHSILYDVNKLPIQFLASKYSPIVTDTSTQCVTKIGSPHPFHTTGGSSMEHAVARWPHCLRKFKHLRLHISVDQGTTGEDPSVRHHMLKLVNHDLYSLCCFLADSNRLKEMVVELEEQSTTGTKWFLKQTLWPLLKVGGVNLRFVGVPDQVVAFFERQLQGSAVERFDAFGVAQDVGLAAGSESAVGKKSKLLWDYGAKNSVYSALAFQDYVDCAYDARLTKVLKTLKRREGHGTTNSGTDVKVSTGSDSLRSQVAKLIHMTNSDTVSLESSD